MIAISLVGAVLVSWALTGILRRYAVAASLLDIPNARSSHTTPTPRGGGVAIVATFLVAMVCVAWLGDVRGGFVSALLGGGCIVAVLGFVDDRRPLPARWRFLGHLAAGVWALWAIGGIPPVPMLGFTVDLGWFGPALAIGYIAWMINLFNFMDGIDGIASIEAVTVCCGGALCWWVASSTPNWYLPGLFAACVTGFLLWNFPPPARIFMGDAGSGFIGFVIALFSLWTAQAHQQIYWSWFILIGVFMVDATTTLVRRVRRGEQFNEAHRNHAYQYASRKHRSHLGVSLGVGAINLAWLLPIALMVAVGWVDGLAATVVAYVPLVWLAFRYKAGLRKEQSE